VEAAGGRRLEIEFTTLLPPEDIPSECRVGEVALRDARGADLPILSVDRTPEPAEARDPRRIGRAAERTRLRIAAEPLALPLEIRGVLTLIYPRDLESEAIRLTDAEAPRPFRVGQGGVELARAEREAETGAWDVALRWSSASPPQRLLAWLEDRHGRRTALSPVLDRRESGSANLRFPLAPATPTLRLVRYIGEEETRLPFALAMSPAWEDPPPDRRPAALAVAGAGVLLLIAFRLSRARRLPRAAPGSGPAEQRGVDPA
jgi:hypothetical protein